MPSWTSYCALLAGVLFFVGRLYTLPSLEAALGAGLLAAASAAVGCLALDARPGRVPRSGRGLRPQVP